MLPGDNHLITRRSRFRIDIPAAIPLFKVRFSRIGLKLAETFAKGYRWQHEAVIALARPTPEP
jgi:16S rRNA (cytosine1407-C5)-methyltransferase